MRKISALLLSVFMMIGITACTSVNISPKNTLNLTKITDKNALKAILLANSPNRNLYNTLTPGSAAAITDSSKTNTQVEGVDEGDSVKTNGDYIVNILNNKVYVVSVATKAVVKTISYEPAKDAKEYRNPNEIYLTDTQLIIMGTVSAYRGGIGIYDTLKSGAALFWIGAQDSFIDIVNLSDMKVSGSFDLKGSFFTSRLKGNELIVIANQWQTLVYDDKNNPSVVEPTVTDTNTGIAVSSLTGGNAYVLPNNQGSSFVNVLKLDLTGTVPPKLSSYLGWIQTVYMNDSDLIIAQSRYTYDEKTQIGSQYTDLVRFDVASMEVKAQGTLKGYLLNQFSLDIYDTTLRVALTNWDKVSSNRIVTMDMGLNPLDSIENLAPKESIRAVRFIGNKGYVVTYQNIDPLFVLDLADPHNIAVTGELKVPGFSTYLQPVSADVLWGIAEDLTVTPITQDGQTINSIERFGVKISLFNVSDPTHPIELGHLNILGPSGTSEAQYNHKAIVFDNSLNLVYIPFSDYHYDATTCKTGEKGDTLCNYSYESGIKVLQITETDVKLIKSISVSGSYDQNTWISRCVYVGDKLYLISNTGLTILDRNTFAKLGTITY